MITTQPQPTIIADTLAEVSPSGYPQNSLIFIIENNSFYITDGTSFSFIGNKKLEDNTGKSFLNSINSINYLNIN